MSDDRVIYFGFTVLLFSFILLIIALIITQPVTISFNIDLQNHFGDISTTANPDTPNINIPKIEINNPVSGIEFKNRSLELSEKKMEIYNGTSLEIPGFKIKSSFDGFNTSIHASGQVEAPVYVLALAYMNRNKMNVTN